LSSQKQNSRVRAAPLKVVANVKKGENKAKKVSQNRETTSTK